jgi:hypothetical protein
MPSWTFYPAFIGTFISVVAWTYLAQKEHLRHMPRTLSELAAEKPEALNYYRIVLWLCGPLFAITMFAFVLPRVLHPFIIGIACALTIVSEMAIGFFPAQKGKITVHDVVAGLMGVVMIITAYLFAWSLSGAYAKVEFAFGLCMSILGILCMIDRKRYLFYELPLIFIAHFSVLVAALALK